MPKEDILVEGDYVNELFVIVTGEVQVRRTLRIRVPCATLTSMLTRYDLPTLDIRLRPSLRAPR